ncbi:unnamed protein product, partial [marine sediment metagenome]
DDSHFLEIKQAAVTLDKIYPSEIKEFIWSSTLSLWIAAENGTGGLGAVNVGYNIGIGEEANCREQGVAIGYHAQGNGCGVGVGYLANGGGNAVAVGANAVGYLRGVAIGYFANTNSQFYSQAYGYHSQTIRYGETSININGADNDQENNVVQGRWEGETADATPIEIFCAGQANQRFTIRPNSALAFRMTIVARDNVAGHAAMWTVVDGLIKRDGLGNTVMVTCTVTEVADESTDWAVTVTADDVNEALIITVTGD